MHVNQCLTNWRNGLRRKRKLSEIKIELLQQKIELKEAELCLKEAIEDMDEELKRMQKEEEKKLELGLQEDDDIVLSEPTEGDKTKPKQEEDDEEDGEGVEDEEDVTSSSFGSVEDQDLIRNYHKGKRAGKSPFAVSSLSFGASGLPVVPTKHQQPFSIWKQCKLETKPPPSIPELPFHQLPLKGHC